MKTAYVTAIAIGEHLLWIDPPSAIAVQPLTAEWWNRYSKKEPRQ